ncbi:hypothetical protein RCH06_000498 [Polaromonas sp. CG_9.5]|uniref:DUF4197 family protein n=1 Tax=Polaromonas sp. CG_9.5 TaxID=3071705 RepID=UPI002E07DBD7|nr:hypothetical protein [Polaromonas sp. CG_9.5]
MQRRNFNQAGSSALGLLIFAICHQAHAVSPGNLSPANASNGLKTALKKGVLETAALLGKTDGFPGTPKVRIPLPGYLKDRRETAEKL